MNQTQAKGIQDIMKYERSDKFAWHIAQDSNIDYIESMYQRAFIDCEFDKDYVDVLSNDYGWYDESDRPTHCEHSDKVQENC
jgi:hypothetical protein